MRMSLKAVFFDIDDTLFSTTDFAERARRGAADAMRRHGLRLPTDHILREQGARRVTLIQQTHNLPTMERVRNGGRLDDPESYEERELGVFP